MKFIFAIMAWVLATVLFSPATGIAEEAAKQAGASHGLSAFGSLKYKPGFTAFDYVNVDAPVGGSLRMRGLNSFDSVNPFIMKGVVAEGAELPFESLMVRAWDEPDSYYGLLAETVTVGPDRHWAEFVIRPQALWHDGTPVTADDVVFSHHILTTKGHPRFRMLYHGIARVTALSPHVVRFEFDAAERRDLPILAATMPILSKAYYANRPFDKTTLTPPMGSGPYRLVEVDPGRSLTYQRADDYWGWGLPVNRGRHNFARLIWDYYRDRNVAMEAFKSGAYDFREEFTSKIWAMDYDFPAVKDGRVVRLTIPDNTPSGVQAFFLNTRRDKFSDPRVREALDLAFDFNWTNKNLFHSQYQRMTSMFENSDMAARGLPDEAELALLEPLRGQVPDAVFGPAFVPPQAESPGNNRKNLRRARKLLAEAGWKITDGKLTNGSGEVMDIEFLMFEQMFERIAAPMIRNLERLGISARMRIIDVAQYQNRLREFDYDVITMRFVQLLTPGIEQRNYWGSAEANIPGSLNYAGVQNKAVDILVEKIIAAPDRPALLAATRALDRVLMAGHYIIPQWFKGAHNLAFWDRFGRPDIKPQYARGVIDLWWVDPDKAVMSKNAE